MNVYVCWSEKETTYSSKVLAAKEDHYSIMTDRYISQRVAIGPLSDDTIKRAEKALHAALIIDKDAYIKIR